MLVNAKAVGPLLFFYAREMESWAVRELFSLSALCIPLLLLLLLLLLLAACCLLLAACCLLLAAWD